MEKDLRYPAISSSLDTQSTAHNGVRSDEGSVPMFTSFGSSAARKRGHSSRSWIKIDQSGASQVVVLDKATLMKFSGLPARDLRLMDPLFDYPSKILGREKAIVISLEQIRCIVMADCVMLVKSLDGCVLQYESELCHRLRMSKHQNDDLPFEFKALELALELTSEMLDEHVTELEVEIYPVLEELASSINTVKLERLRRLKSNLLALTYSVQKVRDEIEHLMDDDEDMAEMYLTQKMLAGIEARVSSTEGCLSGTSIPAGHWVSRSAPVSPTHSSVERQEKASINSGFMSWSNQHGSWGGSLNHARHVEELEMLLEAYFVVIDNTLGKLLSLKEYIDDTEDFINIKLDNVRNRLIQFELLLTASTFVVTIFAVVMGVFGMNFAAPVFDSPSNFNWVLVASSVCCGLVYASFLLYAKHKRLLPM